MSSGWLPQVDILTTPQMAKRHHRCSPPRYFNQDSKKALVICSMLIHLVASEVRLAREEIVVARPFVHVMFWPAKTLSQYFLDSKNTCISYLIVNVLVQIKILLLHWEKKIDRKKFFLKFVKSYGPEWCSTNIVHSFVKKIVWKMVHSFLMFWPGKKHDWFLY